ncbi:acyl-CoA dehydrogenase family protein [Chloroflexota bacterium]
MDFEFTEEQNMLRAAIRDFAKAEIAPLVDEAEANERPPVELFPLMGSLGYLCTWASEEYGGAEMGRVAECIINEELAYLDMGIAEILVSSHPDGDLVVYNYGSEDLKQRFVIPAVKGEKIVAIAATEAEAGSDIAAIKTKAVEDGNDYILNGSKIFITGGTIADFVPVLAYTDVDKGPKEGMSVFIVEKGTPGFSSNKLNPVGQRPADVAELAFDNCRIPRENLVGEEGRGFSMMMDILGSCRINHAARSLGMAQAALDASVKYAKERVTFGQPIARHQVIQFKLSAMATEVEAARWMVYRAAWLQDQGKPFRKETSMAKYYAAEVVRNVTREAVHIQGGYGLMMESPVQRYLRDAEFQAVTEGTQEMQLMTIGRELLR